MSKQIEQQSSSSKFEKFEAYLKIKNIISNGILEIAKNQNGRLNVLKLRQILSKLKKDYSIQERKTGFENGIQAKIDQTMNDLLAQLESSVVNKLHELTDKDSELLDPDMLERVLIAIKVFIDVNFPQIQALYPDKTKEDVVESVITELSFLGISEVCNTETSKLLQQLERILQFFEDGGVEKSIFWDNWIDPAVGLIPELGDLATVLMPAKKLYDIRPTNTTSAIWAAHTAVDMLAGFTPGLDIVLDRAYRSNVRTTANLFMEANAIINELVRREHEVETYLERMHKVNIGEVDRRIGAIRKGSREKAKPLFESIKVWLNGNKS